MGVQRYRRLSAEQWLELIEEHRRSGLSQRAFCGARAWRSRHNFYGPKLTYRALAYDFSVS